MDKLMEKMFSNPFEIFTNFAGNSAEIMKNNMKYHKACIAYHQAIHDMMEAIDDNSKLINGEKSK
jgi:hypothetical protein